MVNIIISFILLLTIGLAVLYIYKEKKRGSKCIGCPHSRECAFAKNGDNCSCK